MIVLVFVVILGLSHGYVSVQHARSIKIGGFYGLSSHPSVLPSSFSGGKSSLATLSSSVEDDSPIADLSGSGSLVSKVKNGLRVLYKFSRPHTIKGTILASLMGITRALLEHPDKITLTLLPRAALGLLALLCGNAYIVGINQIYDVDVDSVNKPFLPLPAKLISEDKAWGVVIAALLTGVYTVHRHFSLPIQYLYILGLALGSLYTLPPIQLKRVPLLAGSTIAVVRGFLLNFGVYYAVREALGVAFSWNPVVVFISSFMTVFASVIAVTKDLPDIEGDKKYSIPTFAARYGVLPISRVATGVLSAAYALAMCLPLVLPGKYRPLPVVLGHGVALLYILSSYAQLEESVAGVKKFYKSIWNLFYFEYLLYPFI
eukprot:gene31731-38351_t